MFYMKYLRAITLSLILLLLTLSFGIVSAQETEEPASAALECEAGFRLFTHELLWTGTPDGVCIPEEPKRIAFAWIFHIPALVRAGFPFAGMGSTQYVTFEFPAWSSAVEDIPSVGLPPNLEAVLEVEPDLIIEPSWVAEENYDEMSVIAPTVAFQFDFTHQWKQLAEMYFEIAGMSNEYDVLMAEYEARAVELGGLIGNPEEIEVSLVWVDTQLNLDTDFSVGGMILEDVGFARPETQLLPKSPEEMLADGIDPFFLPISWEQAQDADGDFIIAYGDFRTATGQARQTEIEANPLWQSLSAVKAGNVYYTSVNWAGGDIAGAHNILDDIAKAFGVFDQLSPNPYNTVSTLGDAEVETTPEATQDATEEASS
jgi:iron complex transport system substrate-binding protein